MTYDSCFAGLCLTSVIYHGKRHPAEMGAIEVEQFLTYLAKQLGVSVSNQNQALAAILHINTQY
jgi:hypothetical protein